MKRQLIKVFMIVLQFAFYFLINKCFKVHDRIMYNTFFIYLVLNIIRNMYSFKTILIWDELKKQLQVHLEYLLIMLINDIAFWSKDYIIVHLIIGLSFTFFNIIILGITRKIFKNELKKDLIIIGIGKTAKHLTEIINKNPFTMYKLKGYISLNGLLGIEENLVVNDSLLLDSYKNIKKILTQEEIKEVIFAVPEIKNNQMKYLIDELDDKVPIIKYIPEFNSTYTFNSQIENYDGLMLVSVKINIANKLYGMIKRIFDIIISILGIVLLIPLTAIIWLKTDEEERKKGLFFTQKRIGQNGKEILIYKYRSMISEAEKKLEELMREAPLIREEYEKNKKLKNDPRITQVGKFLRKTSLDEFPQFINVLKGEMSFVGARPYLLREKEDMGSYYDEIVKTKPGITGMWQVNGRSETNFEERLMLDEYYHKNWSLWLDTTIIVKTIKSVLEKKGAY